MTNDRACNASQQQPIKITYKQEPLTTISGNPKYDTITRKCELPAPHIGVKHEFHAKSETGIYRW